MFSDLPPESGPPICALMSKRPNPIHVASLSLPLTKANPAAPHQGWWHAAHRLGRSHPYTGVISGPGTAHPMATGGRIVARGAILRGQAYPHMKIRTHFAVPDIP